MDEAEGLARKTVEITKQFNHNDSDVSMVWSLGKILRREGKLEEAETVLREDLQFVRDIFNNEHAARGMVLTSLGEVLQQQDRIPEAEAVYRESLAEQRKLLAKTRNS